MDGGGFWRDNVFVERLWKSVKHEKIYLYGYDTVSVARRALAKCIDLYNRRRPYSTFGGVIPDTVQEDHHRWRTRLNSLHSERRCIFISTD